MSILLLFACIIVLSLAAAHAADSFAAQVAYIAVGGEKRIDAYDVDHDTGTLHRRHTVALPDGAGALAVGPNRRFLYAALHAKAIVTLALDPTTGALRLLGSIDVEGDATYLAPDRSGRFLLAAYYSEGRVDVHRIGDDGLVVAGPVQRVATDRHAHAVSTDASNRFAFVPHTGPSAIYQFRFDAQTGTLTPNEPAVVILPNGAGPRHFCIHPMLDVAYFVNENNSSVTACHFNRAAGTLMEMQNLSTLRAGYTGTTYCADIHLTPDNRFLYASNRGHDSLAAFAVDGRTGRLTYLDCYATEKWPRSFAIDATGRYLYAAGEHSVNVAAYRIRDTGALLPLATYNVGERPEWVEMFSLA